jgi:N-acetylglucosamine kinase-like BadF-type ATPase
MLIADSGSTKTDWMLVSADGAPHIYQTAGLNPFVIGREGIEREVRETLLPALGDACVSHLHFYGTGCASSRNQNTVKQALQTIFPYTMITVDHDMTAAAKALCGHEPGIACILGTGSNCCVYDGTHIVDKLTSPGYLAGDEGSGNHLGKAVIRTYCYRAFPPDLEAAFRLHSKQEPSEIIARLYDAPKPNAYLASFTTFLSSHREHPFVRDLVKGSFSAFVRRQLLRFEEAKSYPIHFTGSISYYFSDMLQETLEDNRLQLGKIVRKPIHGLLEYHTLGAGN